MSTLTKILIALAVLLSGLFLLVLMKTATPDAPNIPSQPAANTANIEGDWIGTLQSAQQSLRIVFHISRNEQGNLIGTWDSVDQGVTSLPINAIELNGNEVHIRMDQSGAAFVGVISADGVEIEGTWNQQGYEVPLTLTPLEEPITIERPQEPSPPYDYTVEELTFPNEAAGIELGGTLTLPSGEGPFPAVVLISGSGAQNRNEEMAGHKPFLVLADYLTRQGIAVLRYDDRGVGQSSGDFSSAAIPDFATDTWSAIQYLLTRPEIYRENIGLIGHSEGGMTAPLVAVDHSEIAFLVLMAAPGVTGEEIILTQTEDIQRASGVSADVIELTRRVNEAIFSIIKSEADNQIAEEQIREYLETLSDEERQKVGLTQQAVDQRIDGWMSPWLRHFLTYDPAPTLQQVDVPVLAINGSNDLQVDATTNLDAIEAALMAGGNGDFEVREYGGLNHLFQTSEGGGISEYSQIAETIAPQILEKIASWINARVQ